MYEEGFDDTMLLCDLTQLASDLAPSVHKTLSNRHTIADRFLGWLDKNRREDKLNARQVEDLIKLERKNFDDLSMDEAVEALRNLASDTVACRYYGMLEYKNLLDSRLPHHTVLRYYLIMKGTLR